MKIFFLSLALASALHGHHVSVMDMKYDPTKQELQANVQLFANELEDHLRTTTGDERFDIRNLNEANQRAVEDFITENIAVSGEAGNYEIQYLSHRLDGNNFIVKLRWERVAPGWIEVRNSGFLTISHGQENIVHLIAAGGNQSAVCRAANPSVRFEI